MSKVDSTPTEKLFGSKTRAKLLRLFFENPEKSDVYYAVLSLPKKYKAVIHLFYYEELSIEEISHILKEKQSTIRTRLTRARKKLKEMLKEDIDV